MTPCYYREVFYFLFCFILFFMHDAMISVDWNQQEYWIIKIIFVFIKILIWEAFFLLLSMLVNVYM